METLDSHDYKALYDKLKAESSRREQLFTILAHDLRGPLGTARNLLTLWCNDPTSLTQEDLKETLPHIKGSLDDVYGLLENLLFWVRSQMEEITIQRGTFHIKKMLQTLAVWMDKTLLFKGLGLEVVCKSDLTLWSDELMVQTILRNFMSNASKFSHRGGVIVLKAWRDDEAREIHISVKDQGLGMSEEKKNQLFSQMIKGETGTSGESGSGLGLMFSADMCRRLGGRIEVESKLGKGSMFTLVLPDEVEGDLEAVEVHTQP